MDGRDPNIGRNSTFVTQHALPEYWAAVDKVALAYPTLNYAERLWAAWYDYMQNDILATGIMSFTMHEVVYFGRSLPWIFMDCLPSVFNRWKIQHTKIPSAYEQWQCAFLVFLSHVTVELPQIWLVSSICPTLVHTTDCFAGCSTHSAPTLVCKLPSHSHPYGK